MPLQGAHVPTGRIALEELLRMAIAEFGARPRRKDWEQVLERTQAGYEDWRTWPAPRDAGLSAAFTDQRNDIGNRKPSAEIRERIERSLDLASTAAARRARSSAEASSSSATPRRWAGSGGRPPSGRRIARVRGRRGSNVRNTSDPYPPVEPAVSRPMPQT
jgi:hypothetical protein